MFDPYVVLEGTIVNSLDRLGPLARKDAELKLARRGLALRPLPEGGFIVVKK